MLQCFIYIHATRPRELCKCAQQISGELRRPVQCTLNCIAVAADESPSSTWPGLTLIPRRVVTERNERAHLAMRMHDMTHKGCNRNIDVIITKSHILHRHLFGGCSLKCSRHRWVAQPSETGVDKAAYRGATYLQSNPPRPLGPLLQVL